MNDENRNLPINWEAELAQAATAAAASERPALAAISLKAGIMMYEKMQVPGNALDAIVVASVMERRFYKNKYDPNKLENPVCFAHHDGTDGVPWIPHAASQERQAEACAECRWNQWGSDPGGGKGKACKEVRKLCLLPNVNSKDMALLSVPVMSVKRWSNYVNGIAAQFRRPPWGMVTHISVKPDPRSQFVVNFDPVEEVSQDQLPGVHAKIKMAMDVLTTPYEPNAPEPPSDGKKKKFQA